MAKAVGLIGSLKGKVGNTVFVTRRGIQIARVYQPVVAQPKSTRQQLSRAKFSLATDTLRPFVRFLRAGWQNVKPTYEFQQGVRSMIPVGEQIITGTSPNVLSVDKARLAKVFSAGGLEPFYVPNPDFSTENKVTFNVTMPAANFMTSTGAAVGCGLVVAMWNQDMNSVIVQHFPLTKHDDPETCEFIVPESWSGLHVYMYAFAKQIPEAVNGITSSTEPWMYPAKTSETIEIGEGDLA